MSLTDKIQYEKLKSELSSYLPALRQAAGEIKVNDVSKYPIFVIHQHFMDIGIQMVDKDKVNGNWSVNASTLEEFVTKQIVANDKLDDFRKTYNSKPQELCLFVLSELGADFIFIPSQPDK